MTDGAIYKAGWTLADVDWSRFDRSKVNPELVAAVKTACLVEYNAPDYVDYLLRVYHDSPQWVRDRIEQWGKEETQHGQALARWAALADPSFDFDKAFARFQALYRPDHFKEGHFKEGLRSVRGSKRGEMIARCVVESGTSSFYSAMRDAADEPVLREVAGRIAADEFRHYRLFYEILEAETEPDMPRWRKVWVAVTRVTESDDDELAGAFYCAMVPAEESARTPYRRRLYVREYRKKVRALYRRHHIDKMVAMSVKPAGIDPSGRVSQFASAALWRMLHSYAN